MEKSNLEKRKNEALKALKFAVQMIVEKKYADFLNHIGYQGWTEERLEEIINPYLQGRYAFVLPSEETYKNTYFYGLEEGNDLVAMEFNLWEIDINGNEIPFEGDFTLAITYEFTNKKILFDDLRMM